MGVVPFVHACAVILSVLHFRVVHVCGARSREGTVLKPSLKMKTGVSGIEISPEGEERIVDSYAVMTLVSRMYDLGDYVHEYCNKYLQVIM